MGTDRRGSHPSVTLMDILYLVEFLSVIKIKDHNVFYTHTSIYSKLILLIMPNTDNFHLTPCMIYRTKTGNIYSEFMCCN